MIAAELRGGSKPSLNETLGWIGSRVDDIYGTNVGRLEDVWIDPGTGVPRWLLVKEGRFGGRTTLIPFEDATAGAGHVWVPYEREIVRQAPEIEAGAPLTQQVEAALRRHYAANVPAEIANPGQPEPPAPGPPQGSGAPTATIRFATGPAEAEPSPEPPAAPQAPQERPPLPQRYVLREGPQPPESEQASPPLHGVPPPPPRPAPPIAPPKPGAYPPRQQHTAPTQPPQGWQAQPETAAPQGWPTPGQPPAQDPARPWEQAPTQAPTQPPMPPQSQPPSAWPGPPAPSPIEALSAMASSPEVHYVEIELSGELRISGELRSIRVVPRDPSGQ